MHFYSSGNYVNKYVVLYVLFKLNFVAGKTLIVVEDNH